MLTPKCAYTFHFPSGRKVCREGSDDASYSHLAVPCSVFLVLVEISVSLSSSNLTCRSLRLTNSKHKQAKATTESSTFDRGAATPFVSEREMHSYTALMCLSVQFLGSFSSFILFLRLYVLFPFVLVSFVCSFLHFG